MLLVTAAGPGIISGSPGRLEFLWRLLLPKPASDADLSLWCREGGECEGQFCRFCHRQKILGGLKQVREASAQFVSEFSPCLHMR